MTLEEYLNDIKLTKEEYDIFVNTWVGIEKLKGILGGRVDGEPYSDTRWVKCIPFKGASCL